MAQDTALQVIELQQLPIIVERLHSVKADIERRTAEATSLICTKKPIRASKMPAPSLPRNSRSTKPSARPSRAKSLNPTMPLSRSTGSA